MCTTSFIIEGIWWLKEICDKMEFRSLVLTVLHTVINISGNLNLCEKFGAIYKGTKCWKFVSFGK